MKRLISAFQTSVKLKHNCQGFWLEQNYCWSSVASSFSSNLSLLVYWTRCSVNVLHIPHIFSSALCGAAAKQTLNVRKQKL